MTEFVEFGDETFGGAFGIAFLEVVAADFGGSADGGLELVRES